MRKTFFSLIEILLLSKVIHLIELPTCQEAVKRFSDLICDKNPEIGRGGFGVVYLVISKSEKKEYALKTLAFEKQDDKKEYNLVHNWDHPNIIKMYDMKENNNFLYIQMELGKNGSMKKYFEKNKSKLKDIKFLASTMRKIVDGLIYMNEKGYVHADMKLDNVIFDEKMEPKIIDFGLIKPFGKKGNPSGTLLYLDPFMINNLNYIFDDRSDVYSCGVMLHLLTNELRFPFDDITILGFYNKILNGRYRVDYKVNKFITILANLSLQFKQHERISS